MMWQNATIRRVRHRRLVVVASLLLAAVGGIAVLGLATGGFVAHRIFDRAALQRGVATVLARDFHIDAVAITCPGAVPVTAGLRFSCDALVGDDRMPVSVRVVDRDGRYMVTRPR